MAKMKTILVTGGAGFIGSNFVNYMLAKYQKYRIIVLDALTYAGSIDNFLDKVKSNKSFEFVQGNIRNAQLVNDLMKKTDIVVHFAAESHVAKSIYDNIIFFETDVLGTQTIANSVLDNKNVERFIHISSSEVYGTAETSPMDESHPLNPRSPYASAKAGADRLVYSYYVTYGIPAIIVRPFNNYGQHQHLEKMVPRFITSAVMNKPLTVHGDGKASRDWLYVLDDCEAIDKILHANLEKIKGEVFNLGTGREISIIEIAKIILKKMGKSEDMIAYTENRPGQVQRHISSTNKILKSVGWKAKTKFEDGIQTTIEWYKANTQWWEKQLWMKYY